MCIERNRAAVECCASGTENDEVCCSIWALIYQPVTQSNPMNKKGKKAEAASPFTISNIAPKQFW